MATKTYRLLNVDLTASSFDISHVEPELIRIFLGGKTLGFYLGLRSGLAEAEPLSPANQLWFLTGPLSGNVPGGGAVALVTKSPLTCTLTDPVAQGKLGYSLKAAGFDGLVVTGSSPTPVYLEISDAVQRIVPAKALWRMSCSEVYTALRSVHSSIPNMSVVAVGPAGENMVRFASVLVDGRAFGRGGAGAVMGSKGLKAIVVGGRQRPRAAKPQMLLKQQREIRSYLSGESHPYYGYQHGGTASIYSSHMLTGCMSGPNYRSFDYEDQLLVELGDSIVESTSKDTSACFRCYLVCARTGTIREGKYAGRRSNGPEFETTWAFGPQCGNNSTLSVFEADYLCDELGLDTISTGSTIGFYRECVEKGIVPSAGRGASLAELISAIAYRQGIGEVLAEGTRLAAEEFGPDARKLSMHVKGLETPAFDPRGFAGIGLAYAISARGGCHRKAFCPEESKGQVSGTTLEGKPEMVIMEEDKAAYRDSLVVCKWAAGGRYDPYYPEALEAVLGYRLDHEDLLNVGRRAINMARIFNLRQGYSRKDDTLPERFFIEQKGSGPLASYTSVREDLEVLKDRYFQLRGWANDGTPKLQTLSRLGLADFIA